MRVLRFVVIVAVLAATVGCISPMYEVRKFLQSPAGQKVIDKVNVEAEANNPAIELYLINGMGVRAIGVSTKASAGGDVTEDERGPAEPFPNNEDGTVTEPGVVSGDDRTIEEPTPPDG